MRNTVCIFLVLAVILALCACSTQTDPTVPADAGTHPSEQMATQNNTAETTLPAETEPPVPALLAAEYLDTVHYISKERADQTYLVCGTDRYGDICYGLLHASGNFEPLTEYGAYFPLADGNYFVTNEEKIVRDFDYTRLDTISKPLCANGKIIDCNGNVLYEPDANGPYQKMYVVNSNTIFVLAASTGFEGIDAYWGVLDNMGNWVHKLDNTGPLVDTIKQYNLIEMNGDGSWTYAAARGNWGDYRILYAARCGGYNDNENNSLCFHLGMLDDTDQNTKKGEVIIYQASSNSFAAHFNCAANGESHFEQISDNLWSSFESRSSTGTTSDTLYDSTGRIGSIKNYLFTKNGVKYWEGGSLFEGRDGVLYSDEYPDGIIYPENIASRITSFLMVKDGKVYMKLQGADDLPYLAVGDLQGNIIVEPYRPANFGGSKKGVGDDGFVACIDDNTLYIVNLFEPAEEAKVIEIGDERVDKAIFLGNDLIAVIQDHTNEEDEAKIFNFDGEQIA